MCVMFLAPNDGRQVLSFVKYYVVYLSYVCDIDRSKVVTWLVNNNDFRRLSEHYSCLIVHTLL